MTMTPRLAENAIKTTIIDENLKKEKCGKTTWVVLLLFFSSNESFFFRWHVIFDLCPLSGGLDKWMPQQNPAEQSVAHSVTCYRDHYHCLDSHELPRFMADRPTTDVAQ